MPGTDGCFAGSFGDTLIDGMRLGRFGKPEDIAPDAVLLVSNDRHSLTPEETRTASAVRGAFD